jgi:xanthine permease XanP
MAETTVAPRTERPQELIYALNEWPPLPRLAMLGFQYAVMDAMYLVLVVIIMRHAQVSPTVGVNLLAVACLGLAIGAVLQSLPRGPVGSGFLAPPVFSAIFLAPSVLAAQIGGMPLVFGMTLFAGAVEVLTAIVLKRLRVLITPVLSGLTVFVVGLELGVVGIGETLDVAHEGLPTFPLHVTVAALTLLAPICLSIWGRGALKLLCSLCGLAVGMIGAALIGLVGHLQLATVGAASWLTLPRPATAGLAFDLGLAPAFLAAGIAAALRTVGVVTTCQRINNAAWQRPDTSNIQRGVLADGLANVIGGALGLPGMSVGPSLVGISGVTGATSRVIAFAAALVLLIFGFSPKLSGLFLLIPQEVAGSLLVFTACFMISGGMQIMLSRAIDTRAVYVIGVSTLLALSESVFPTYFTDLPRAVHSFTSSPLALSMGAALVLSLFFRLGTRQITSIDWDDSDAAIAAAIASLREKMQGWKVNAGLVDTSAEQAREVIGYVVKHHSHHAEGKLRGLYNGLELRIEISYRGSPTAHLPAVRQPHAPIGGELDDEEAAAYVGLRNFLRSMRVDRQQIKARKTEVVARLFYAV